METTKGKAGLMSQKAAKKERSDEKKALVDELNLRIAAATKSRSEKLEQAMSFLLTELSMAADKYRTVNGFMQALSTYESTMFGRDMDNLGNFGFIKKMCASIADKMSVFITDLATKIGEMDVNTIGDDVFDGTINADFIHGDDFSSEEITYQLLLCNLLQNCQPALNDIVEFRAGADAELKKLKTELANAEKN